MRSIVLGALLIATLVPAAAVQAQRQQFSYAGCNLQGTCATASLFYDSMTREAISIGADIRWAADAPGAVAGSSTNNLRVTGVFQPWEGPNSCVYPTRGLQTRCTVGFGPVFPIWLAPNFQPTTLHIAIGYGATEFGDALSSATLTLTAVPEPATLTLLVTGLLALGGIAARRGRRRAA
jgi:hypothetical protein